MPGKRMDITGFGKKWLWVFIIPILGAGVFFVLASNARHLFEIISQSSELSNEWESYSSQSLNITIQIPKNLRPVELPHGNHGDQDVKMVIAVPTASPYIEVASRKNLASNIDTVVAWGEQRLSANFNNVTKISTKELITSGYNGESYSGVAGVYLRYGPFWDTRIFQCLDWYTVQNSTDYIFSFCVHQENWEDASVIFVQMVDSIQFVDGVRAKW
jgi:hypothetical protein